MTCQTPGCGQAIEIITLDTRDWTADAECVKCNLVRWMAILGQMAANGTLPVMDIPGT